MAGYEWEQLRKALATARESDDPAVRNRAESRAGKWTNVLVGIASGRIKIGSRTPVADFPVWLTPEVVRGGFATGVAAAAGPITADETRFAQLAGIEPTRANLFEWFLSADGLRELSRMIDDGDYRVELPEHAALLVIVYLLRIGDSDGARAILEAIRPWRDRVRFWPFPETSVDLPGVHVATLSEVAHRLAAKRPQRQVEAAREAATIWAPFTDRVLAHWWKVRASDGSLGLTFPEGWAAEADELVVEYHQLAGIHSLTSKHRDLGGSLQILLDGIRRVAAGRFDSTSSWRVGSTITSMVAKRGEPGSATLAAFRHGQLEAHARPSHAGLANDASARLWASGVELSDNPVGLLNNAPGAGLESVRSIVKQATHAPVEQLLKLGVVRSAEMLAVLSPQLTAETVAARYVDPATARLVKRTYLAFANRRSVLLLNHATQVGVFAIPWFGALENSSQDRGAGLAKAQAVDLARLAMRYFPGTPIPNSMIRELTRLLKMAEVDAPLTYELASDIFMGSFSEVFQRAAQDAGQLVADTLYSRYYGIDYGPIAKFETESETRSFSSKPRITVPSFDSLVRARAGVTDSGWLGVAVNGTVIEQAQILTTHNLAPLVQLGVEVIWIDQARSAWNSVRAHLSNARGSKPLHHRKNAAFAWRQALFFLALASPEEVVSFLAEPLTRGLSPETAEWCELILNGLRDAVTGEEGPPQPFLGWVAKPSA